MSLARVKVWIPGDVLTAADLNGEFNNVLNNPISLISPSTGAINFNLQAHTGLLPSVITASSGTSGQVLGISSGGNAAWQAAPATPSRVVGLQGIISSQTGTFSANAYVMRSTPGTQSWTVSATSSFSVSVGTAGPAAGGRDIAGAFASTYVHWYAITTGSGSTAPAGLVSTNPPTAGPVALPTGYSGWTYLGSSPYSSSSTTVTSTHRFRGNMAAYLSNLDNTILSAGASTSLLTISISSGVPQNSVGYFLEFANNTAVAAASISVDAASTYYRIPAVAGVSPQVYTPFTSEGLSYQNSVAGGSITINLNGYVMPNGDA